MDRLLNFTTGLSLLLIVLVLASVRRAHIRVEYSVSWLLAGLCAVYEAYGPALPGPSLFDDSSLPMNVPGLAHLPFLLSIRGVRPLLMASYWLNERLVGTDTAQCHEWNVLIHFLNALL